MLWCSHSFVKSSGSPRCSWFDWQHVTPQCCKGLKVCLTLRKRIAPQPNDLLFQLTHCKSISLFVIKKQTLSKFLNRMARHHSRFSGRHRRRCHGRNLGRSGTRSPLKGGMILVIFLCVFGSILLLVGVTIFSLNYDIVESIDVEIAGTIALVLGVVLMSLCLILYFIGRRRRHQHHQSNDVIESEVIDEEIPLA